VQADVELARQRGALAHEIIRAMMRNGRRNGGAHDVAIEGPAVQRLAHHIERGVARREAQALDSFCTAGGSASSRPG